MHPIKYTKSEAEITKSHFVFLQGQGIRKKCTLPWKSRGSGSEYTQTGSHSFSISLKKISQSFHFPALPLEEFSHIVGYIAVAILVEETLQH